ncbi:MAG: hypothetical protein Q9191_002602 [Dirinaria sp. TL-2023a]
MYFRKSNFSTLFKEYVGITSLRNCLSQLLFDYVKQKLSKLRKDLEDAFTKTQLFLAAMSISRATPQECKAFLTQLSLDFYEVCKAAVNGHYEGEYFADNIDRFFAAESFLERRRLRAVIQSKNGQFFNRLRTRGYKYHIGKQDAETDGEVAETDAAPLTSTAELAASIRWSKPRAMGWVRSVLVRTRGKELLGNFNPLLVGELFWEQSSKWQKMAEFHIEDVADVCHRFLDDLLKEKCPKDVYARLWSPKIEDALKLRLDGSLKEMDKIMKDIKSYPITYNHYYTDTIKKRRRERSEKSLVSCIDNATQHVMLPRCNSNHTSAQVDAGKAAREYTDEVDPDMKNHSCEEALDCLYSIYKLSQKTFIDNIITQTVERHIVRGLEKIFSPVTVNGLSDTETEAIASEPPSARRQRDLLENKIKKLNDGRCIFRGVMRSAAP